jgi:hypothetical protein
MEVEPTTLIVPESEGGRVAAVRLAGLTHPDPSEIAIANRTESNTARVFLFITHIATDQLFISYGKLKKISCQFYIGFP